MDWILIVFVLAGSTDGGIAVTSVRFNTQFACETAANKLNSSNQGVSRRTSDFVPAFCLQDKVQK